MRSAAFSTGLRGAGCPVLGGTHVLTANFTKTASNTWNYSLTIPAADVGQTGNPVVVKSGTLTFNGNGQLTSPTANVPVSINNLADGASNLSLTWDLTGPNGTFDLDAVSIVHAECP